MQFPGLSLLTAAMVAAGIAAGRGTPAILDVTRMGEGRLRDLEGREQQFDRARLRLDGNGEFQFFVVGDTTYAFAGIWTGDLRFGPISLDLRDAFGHRAEGMGRAWVSDRSWDHDRSFDRVELDGWRGGHEFGLYFDAGGQP
jgi:hypothetical protein